MEPQVHHLTIKHLDESDRPREKLLAKGRASLSDSELLGILLGSGNKDQNAVELAQTMLASVDNNMNNLAKLSVTELQRFNGIGEAKALNIVSALELGRRRSLSEPIKTTSIKCSSDIYHLMRPHLLDLDHEEFWVILLSRSNKVIRKEQISSGGATGTVADPKIIFKRALDYQAINIIAIHNHPSGNQAPSEADKLLTKQLHDAGNLLGIQLLDHLIFTNDGYYSFTDEQAITR